jgi:glucuronate isomerase
VEYFWFRQELESVGYSTPEGITEDERIDRFVEAFAKCRNTTWAQVVWKTVKELYGVDISDAASIREADAAIKAKGQDPAWPMQVCEKLNVKRIVTNIERDVDYPNLPGIGAGAPIWGGYGKWVENISEAADPKAVGEEAKEAIRKDIAGIKERGYRGMRVHAHGFRGRGNEADQHAIQNGHELPEGDLTEKDIHAFLCHGILAALSEQEGMFAQFFLGIESMPGAGVPMGIEDFNIVPNLYVLFKRYSCDFEMVSGSPGLNMDIVQAARILPNVYAGGMWWCNFKASTYKFMFKARLEGLAACKSSILCSDGRCIEWCYAKTKLVKELLADFLFEEVSQGTIGEEDALWVAREWLHDAPARRYV